MSTRLFFLVVFSACTNQLCAQVVLGYNVDSPPVQFGLQKIEKALTASARKVTIQKIRDGRGADIAVLIEAHHSGLQDEGYVIDIEDGRVVISARHSAGAMYGALEVAERLRTGKRITAAKVNPHFTVRALKFNLPWSSYRTGPAMEQHAEVCRDLKFWEAFLDKMAENRFNVLSLWNVHPFSFMVKPLNFPEANDFSESEMAEWKSFWTELFRMCRDRSIEPFIVNWNIAVSPEFAKHYGVMERNDTSLIVRQYTREVVTQVIDEYPDLAGIGITLADWMSNFRQPGSNLPEMTPRQREDWIAETVIAGIKAASRPVKLLHRSVLSADPGEMRRIIDEADLPDTTLVEIKFNWSHGHSSTALLLTHDQHSGQVEDHYWNPLPDNYRIQWMIRNEDFFILRWGDPEFIRRHIAENSHPWVNGYFVGSEGYIPALDLSHKDNDHRTWTYAFEKQWLFYKLWGRLLYDPKTPDNVFEYLLEDHYGISNGDGLLRAFAAASRMPLRLASFHAATWDYTLYSEGFLAPFPSNGGLHDTLSAFISIDELIHHPTLDPRMISIVDFVEKSGSEKRQSISEEITPLSLSEALENDGRAVLKHVESMRSPASGDLTCTLLDLGTWSYLSLYFADKLRAGVALHTYRVTGDEKRKNEAVRLLRKCLQHWKKVADITSSHYKSVAYIDNLGYGKAYRDAQTFSWVKYLPQVERDLVIAQQSSFTR